MPTSARPFHEALSSARPDLAGKRFAVFGLGDREYPETFNFGGKQVEELLLPLGGLCIAPRGVIAAPVMRPPWPARDVGRPAPRW